MGRAPGYTALILLVGAVLLRFGQYGNAITGLDEQFYLLVGDRLWAGELPYVDIWDRKPLGLFLLFGAIRLLPGNGVLAAQLVATAFAAATSWVIALVARRQVSWTPAAMAAIFYLAGANELWLETTQTPIFYNLLLAAAALLTLRATQGAAVDRPLAYWAMAACGTAIQIKTNAVFESAFFCGWLLSRDWVQTHSRSRLATLASHCAAIGAVPTLAAMAAYAADGHFDAWWQANILSILAKGRPNDPAAIDNLWETIILTAPITALALTGLRWQTARFTHWTRETVFILGWIAATTVDFISIGGYFPHYAAPFLLACIPLIASAFAQRRWGSPLFVLALLWPAFHAVWLNPRVNAKEEGFARSVVAALPADVRTRCLFIYEGPVIYYHLAQACRVTRFAFTAHLSSRREAPALGVNAAAELDRTMGRRPGTVLTVAGSHWRDRNPMMERRLARILARDYRIAAVLPYRLNPQDGKLVMWRRIRA